ncbi:hypothetical protein SAMN04488067_101302 [Halorubrum xinjiangense]|uniref:Uncharacterized protein n=1 Tax=Halorubrum xinjiangense TaxID=261291 RepID=A0A1G7HC81_9EURY|nr:hypothetical protein SAMN04488067_101302 [Halorubrum xinjiangense]
MPAGQVCQGIPLIRLSYLETTHSLDRYGAVAANCNFVPVVGECHLTFHSITGRRTGEDLIQGLGVDYFIERGSNFDRVNVFYFGYSRNYFISYIIDVRCCGI